MILFAGENSMLRRQLEEAQKQSQKDLDDAHAIMSELREELAGAEAHSRVKDKFQSALHKLNGVSKQMAEQRVWCLSVVHHLLCCLSPCSGRLVFPASLPHQFRLTAFFCTSQHEENVKKTLEEQAKKEVEIFKKNQDLKAEVDRLNEKLDVMRKGNMKLNRDHQSSSKSMTDQKLHLEDAKNEITRFEKLLETSEMQVCLHSSLRKMSSSS